MLRCDWAQVSPRTDISAYFPGRSMSRLSVLRPGGRWSARSRPRGTSAGEPSLPICTKPQRWRKRNSTLGSLSTCAASLCAPDRTHTYIQQQKSLQQEDSRQKYKNEATIAYHPWSSNTHKWRIEHGTLNVQPPHIQDINRQNLDLLNFTVWLNVCLFFYIIQFSYTQRETFNRVEVTLDRNYLKCLHIFRWECRV